jgi:HlyD family secretion protein
MLDCVTSMARITPLHLIPALIAAASHAGELTIEQRPFSIEKSFNATALPGGDCVLLKLAPKAWSVFEITRIADHGVKVAKGDVLVHFDSEEIDKKLEDARRALASGTLSLAQAELDSKSLQEAAPNKLEAYRRAADVAREENAYFTQTRRKATEERAGQELKRSEQLLSNQREELKQLTKMYEADDVTEDTEEIILIRQQDAVAAAEFALRMETLDHKRTLEVSLPREAKTLADTERDTTIALKKAEAEIPRSLEINKLALESLKTANIRAKQDLADLEADRALFEIKAPADGWFYHGPIENGHWTPGDLVKNLIPHGQPPLHRAFATFVPASAKLGLVSFLDEASARVLKIDLTGTATLSGREDVEIPVTLSKLAAAPSPDGSYRADLSVTWPQDLVPAAGATALIRFVSYQKPAAIAIPTKAIGLESAGWTVEVKLADGKTEHRPVKRGRVSKDETEILSGLEVGQVIIVPS